jgi:hypothetical protein
VSRRLLIPGQQETEIAVIEAADFLRQYITMHTSMVSGIEDIIRMTVLRVLYLVFVAASGESENRVNVVIPGDAGVWEYLFDILRPVSLFTEHQSELMGVALAALTTAPEKRKRGVHFTPRDLAARIVSTTLRPLLALATPDRTLNLRVCDPAVGGGVFLLEVVRQLGGRLYAAGLVQDIYEARRLVAIHCAYGVDKDLASVDCTKLALRFECRAFDMPADWLDDNIKQGDSIVGASLDQIKRFSVATKGRYVITEEHPLISGLVETACRLGTEVRAMRMGELDTIA